MHSVDMYEETNHRDGFGDGNLKGSWLAKTFGGAVAIGSSRNCSSGNF